MHPLTDRDSAIDLTKQTLGMFTGLLRSVRNPSVPAIGRWTIAEGAAHVAEAVLVEVEVLRGQGTTMATLDDLDAYNDERLAQYSDRDLDGISMRIDALVDDLEAAARDADWNGEVKWHAGVPITPATALAIVTAECLVHGFDIAKAAGLDWTVPKDAAAFVIDGYTGLLPHYIDEQAARGLDVLYEIRIRGGFTYHFRLRDAVLQISEPRSDGKVDCYISADPAAFLLTGYGRIGQWAPLLKGQMVAWGRKPWLGLKLTKVIANP